MRIDLGGIGKGYARRSWCGDLKAPEANTRW